ncbi:MAG: LytR C-terminal domain-containing protein [Gemmatimonadota bacterium]
MARRKRNEPLWPLVVVLGLVAGGLGLGALLTGDADPGPALSLLDGPTQDADTVHLPSADDRIRVEVLNAGGVPGAAAAARDELRERGFDVVYYGNASSFERDMSIVFDRAGVRDAAGAVARSIGIASVESEPDSGRLVDVTVLLGSDWNPDSQARAPAAEETIGDEGRRWWDPRRLFTGAR